MAAKTRLRRITLRRVDLIWALGAVLPAASTDDITPVLTGVKWDIDDQWVTLTATDRYRVHQARIPRPDGANKGEFLMTGEQARWIKRQNHGRDWGDQIVRLEWEDVPQPGTPQSKTAITASVLAFDGATSAAFTYREYAISGKFPPVDRLFRGTRHEEGADFIEFAGYNPDYLGAMKYLRRDGRIASPLIYWTPTRTEKAKFEPMLVTDTPDLAKWNGRALIQPNLLTR